MLVGRFLANDLGRAFHAPIEPSAEELDAITRRQSISIVQRSDIARLEMDEETKRREQSCEASRRIVYACVAAMLAFVALAYAAELWRSL